MSNIPKAIGPYSIYTVMGDYLYTSGQLPLDPESGQLVTGFEAQCRQSFTNIKNILAQEGLALADLTKVTVYLSDLENFAVVNQVMSDILTPPYPIRTAYEVGRLPQDALVEIEAVAKMT
ncbi:reactive intermediate/imine deaminase [Aerococcus urinaehominis]|uniref:Reactive intermediate/imine deaminase n=1 Tax=Aerococcus urinaehominis TaxID=128944 RepID=A0A0X8FM04_9LACT|nr:Rid family detoxifying hydrolase [Aerococcus urinaehominis]AMB99783.1 reactive intermediate/imine deaminase [Aerococcus urinaehominis]SDM09175.1 reactive intermediate/imine deaminase [Aerococcus urinaehominis]